MDRQEIFERARTVMARVFNVPADTIGETTRAADVKGWDSLTHLIVLTGIEKRFDVDLPMERAHAAQNVGELVTLIDDTLRNER
jgi:acyl carrier protein